MGFAWIMFINMSEMLKKSCIRLLLTIYPKPVVEMIWSTPVYHADVSHKTILAYYHSSACNANRFHKWQFEISTKTNCKVEERSHITLGEIQPVVEEKACKPCKYFLAQRSRPPRPDGPPLGKPSGVQQQ